MEWPTVPNELMAPADNLKPLPANKKTLSDLLGNANENYGTYYELKEKYSAWQQWYIKQKEIFENVK
jgi:hypothetical protein